MDACSQCNEPNTILCPECAACFACHDLAIRRVLDGIGYARERVRELEVRLFNQKRSGENQPRTFGQRIIGSMWNPSDPKEQDSVALTVRSIERFLGIRKG